jgi:hypothetical protein
VKNLSDDQEYVISLLSQISRASGGKQEVWGTVAPLAGPNGNCAPALADAIWDFQEFWKAQGVFRVIDGVADPRGRTIRQMELALAGLASTPDPWRSIAPEGQLDATACWAACYAWWLRAAPNQTPLPQLALLGIGGLTGGMVTPSGTVDVNAFMTFLSGRHVGMASRRVNPGDLKSILAGSQLPLVPIIIGFSSSIMGGHVNVIHSYDPAADAVTVMECWDPDPSTNANYTLTRVGPAVVFTSKRDGSPFVFKGTHAKRALSHYTSRPLAGGVLIFPG